MAARPVRPSLEEWRRAYRGLGLAYWFEGSGGATVPPDGVKLLMKIVEAEVERLRAEGGDDGGAKTSRAP